MFFRPSRSARGTGSRSISRATSRCPTMPITPCLRISETERKRSVRKKLLLIVLVGCLAVGSASAQFGSGIVYDPTNYQNAVLRYLQLQRQLIELQQTYSKVLAHYNLALQMARNLQNMPARYRAVFSQWRNGSALNTFGNTGGWITGINSGT